MSKKSVLSFVGKIFKSAAIKAVVRPLASNQALMIGVFFWIAKKLVAATDNKLDDKILKALQAEFGDVDTDFIDKAL